MILEKVRFDESRNTDKNSTKINSFGKGSVEAKSSKDSKTKDSGSSQSKSRSDVVPKGSSSKDFSNDKESRSKVFLTRKY
uniref:Uncharacterized protein n=1 Tax=Megaselia scalaris TaxID=36166 RepID=T1H4Z3_MEGSC